MKIVFDIGHPAHVHYFKHTIRKLEDEGHELIVTARKKDVAFELLQQLKIGYIDRGSGSDTVIGKVLYLIKTNIMLYNLLKYKQPDIFVGFGSPYAAQVAYMMRKPSIILDDTENAKLGQLFYKKFATSIISPHTFGKVLNRNHIKFDGYMELSYLHPRYFTPDINVLNKLGLNDNEKYTIIRYVSWKANHDLGHNGISMENKIKAVNEFCKYGKVFVSSEMEINSLDKKHKFNLHPSEMHNAIAFANLVFGESATMASEAAVLGTPAVYIDNIGRGYTTEQEKKYNLVYNFRETQEAQLEAIKKGKEILNDNDSKRNAQIKRNELLSEKIDVTKFLYWYIKNYPQSNQEIISCPRILKEEFK